MKYLYATIALVLFFLAPRCAYAADYSIKFGPSIQDGETNGSSKAFGVRREDSLLGGLSYAFEGGGYVDNAGRGRKSSSVVRAQLGVTPGNREGLFAKAFLGPCLISSKDNQLGSVEQFCTDIGFGVRDSRTFMSAGYAHISNAGIFSSTNHGRDFLMFEAGLRFE